MEQQETSLYDAAQWTVVLAMLIPYAIMVLFVGGLPALAVLAAVSICIRRWSHHGNVNFGKEVEIHGGVGALLFLLATLFKFLA